MDETLISKLSRKNRPTAAPHRWKRDGRQNLKIATDGSGMHPCRTKNDK
jgi:hypothetical protein